HAFAVDLLRGDDDHVDGAGGSGDAREQLLAAGGLDQLGVGQPVDRPAEHDGGDDQGAGARAPPGLVDTRDRGQSAPRQGTFVPVYPRIPPHNAGAWTVGNTHDTTQRTPHSAQAAIRGAAPGGGPPGRGDGASGRARTPPAWSGTSPATAANRS